MHLKSVPPPCNAKYFSPSAEWLACVFGAVLLAFAVVGCGGFTEKSPSLAAVPASLEFQNVVVGQKNIQTVQISNVGPTALNITAVSLVGNGLSLAAVATPIQLASGASKNVTISFAPSSTTTVKGSLTIVSDNSASPLSVPIEATAQAAQPSWQIVPNSFTFGSTTIQTSATENASIKNTGNVAVTVGGVTISGSGFSTVGLSTGVKIDPGQSLNFQVNFRPTTTGFVTGALLVTTPATSAALAMNLGGTGTNLASSTPPSPHSVILSWSPSTSVVVGYRVYRGAISGGPYSLIQSAIVPGTSYTDVAVASGGHYFYVTTAVDNVGAESAFSNEASAVIPNP